MLRDVMSSMTEFAIVWRLGLLIMVSVFVLVLIRTFTHSRKNVRNWSNLALEDSVDPEKDKKDES